MAPSRKSRSEQTLEAKLFCILTRIARTLLQAEHPVSGCLSGCQPCCTVQDPPYDAGSFAKIVTRDASKEGRLCARMRLQRAPGQRSRSIPCLRPGTPRHMRHCLHSCSEPRRSGCQTWQSIVSPHVSKANGSIYLSSVSSSAHGHQHVCCRFGGLSLTWESPKRVERRLLRG